MHTIKDFISKNKSKIAKGLAPIVATGVIGCADKTEVKILGDVNADGINDIMIYVDARAGNRGDYLFIGKEDGSFIKTRKVSVFGNGSKEINSYFQSNEGDLYFFDGEKYTLSPKKEVNKKWQTEII